MREHTVKSFEEELERLDLLIMRMGGLAETQFLGALDALRANDSAEAQRVISGDRALDETELEVNDRALQILARRQPMASDLRETIAAIKIASELERVGDLARNIARRVLHGDLLPMEGVDLGGISRMGERTLLQIKDSLDAYAQRSEARALEVWRGDQELDKIYNSVLREMLTYMLEKPQWMSICMHLLFVAKTLERAGDHTTNIAETIVFLVTGKPLVEERPKESKV